jgi:HD-GYP domain-containing protein (c-di-GMP phosphodiesterase class II)
MKEKKRFKEPLHVTNSVLFIVLILILGIILSLYSYRKTTAIVLSATNKLFVELTRQVEQDFIATTRPVMQVVSLLSYTRVIKEEGLEERLAAVSLLADILKNQPTISGLQVGYANGDYFVLHPLISDHDSKLFSAPEEAAYVVDDIARSSDGTATLHRIFLNRKLAELGRAVPVPTDYDPRKRPWFIQAMETPAVVSTPPYYFYFLHKVGITVSRQLSDGSAVVAADVTLEQIAATLSHIAFTPNTEKVLLNRDNRVLAADSRGQAVICDGDTLSLPSLAGLGSEVLSHVAENIDLESGKLRFSFQGQEWLGMVADCTINQDMNPRLLLVAPADELLADVREVRKTAFLLTLITLLFAMPLTWYISRCISLSIRELAGDAQRVSRFDFVSPITVKSRISEVDELAGSMRIMQKTISRFLQLVQSIAAEQDFATTLKRISRETMTISRADAVVSYLVDDSQTMLVPDVLMEYSQGTLDAGLLPAVELAAFPDRFGIGNDSGMVTLDRQQHQDLLPLLDLLQADEATLISLPLVDRNNNSIGMLALLYRDISDKGQLTDRLSFVRAFSGFAAVSLETRQLLNKQKQLLDSFISLLANAIDAKSAYTGGHCQRVPVITEMLARAACDSEKEPFADFILSSDEWEELHLAAWLHDCGKVTTPEYVVDKATKLETIYNRIHEIRTRFEVLKRDAEISFWQQVAEGGDRDAHGEELNRRWQQLDNDFAFVAACNLGEESMDEEKIARLNAIGGQTWQRTLDDRLGNSWQELQRKQGQPQTKLPVREYLLADKPEQRIVRSREEQVRRGNPWGFKLDVPEFLYDFGELYNLQIERGTLTREERFKINDHIVQTIKMLSQLPFPSHLSRIMEIAGCHHETMDGRGYPRQLHGEQMSLTASMIAIADIFEALTASDRPYKKAKKLSEAIRILHYMKEEQHIHPQLFELFLTSGVYLEYGKKYLDPEQLDEVDITAWLS